MLLLDELILIHDTDSMINFLRKYKDVIDTIYFSTVKVDTPEQQAFRNEDNYELAIPKPNCFYLNSNIIMAIQTLERINDDYYINTTPKILEIKKEGTENAEISNWLKINTINNPIQEGG